MTALFTAVKAQNLVMTVSELADYLRHYIDAQFPDNHIRHWYPMRHVAAYARTGDSEADLICVSLMLYDGTAQEIARIQSFGGPEENWAIAKAISGVIESLYYSNELPLIVDFAAALPLTPKKIKCDGNHTIELLRKDHDLTIIFDGTVDVAHYQAFSKDESGCLYIDELVSDWERLAKNCSMQISQDSQDAYSDQSHR